MSVLGRNIKGLFTFITKKVCMYIYVVVPQFMSVIRVLIMACDTKTNETI